MKNVKPAIILALFSILLLSAVTASAQNVEGVWEGKVWQGPGIADYSSYTNCAYAIKLEQNGNSAAGQAYIECFDSAGKSKGEFNIIVTVFSNTIYYKDLGVTNSTGLPYGKSWCVKEGTLNYDARNNRIYGGMSAYANVLGINTPCQTITLDLYRKTEPPKYERPIPKSGSNSWAGNGTGIVIDSKGIISTNYHVVKDASEIEVDFGKGEDKRSYKCEVIITDKKNDLAILKINDKRFSGFGSLPYTFKTSTARAGESIFALGYPKALSGLGTEIKYTRGDISALSGVDGDPTTYTLSLSIQPGNSGGPLFDFNGNLVGITNAKIVSPDVDNVSYAIKSLYLKSLIDLSSYRITLPTGSGLAGKPIIEQLEILSDYVGLVKIR